MLQVRLSPRSSVQRAAGRRVPNASRRAALVFLLALAAASVAVGSAPDRTQRRIDQLASGYAWSVLTYEGRHLPDGLRLIIDHAIRPPDSDDLGPAVRAYLERSDGADFRSGPSAPLLLAAAVGRQLRRSGAPTLAGFVFPPVTLAFAEPPRLLVVSPREQIRLTHWLLLDGRMPLSAAEELESALEQLDLSALVVEAVAISTYPPLIPRGSAPLSALQMVAHEWTHLVLFASPLGRAYGTGPEARAMNETTADLVAEEVVGEIARTVGLEKPVGGGAPDPALRDRLRRILLGAEELLSAGDVAGAEAYMEAERRALAADGYRIRRLNQAYFAFHGNYAEGPARSTEIPDALRSLRARSGTLGEFLSRVGELTTLADLRRASEAADRGW